ncbi:MAG: hypothetical protein KDK70_38435 [Myxococcales bacterium]|nr:hypothetical protein [Myxococcales bacterium]
MTEGAPAGGRALLWVVAGALLLRVLRAALRWDEIALAYAAYQQAWLDGGWLTFHGLHPPGYSLIFALLPASAAAWLLWSALCSAGAVWLVGRAAGVGAAVVLAVDPLQLSYAAEVNDYPQLVLLCAACLHERGRGRWLGLAVCGVLAGWTHLLGGLFAGLCALSLADRRAAGRVLAVLAVGCAPVLWSALELAGAASTYAQGGLEVGALLRGLWDKGGPWAWTWGLALILGRDRGIQAILVVLGLAVLGLMQLGIADAHQQPYWLVLGPLAAVSLGRWGWWIAPLGLAWAVPREVEAVAGLRAGLARERAVDVALAESRPGDVLWLLKPALKVDDDKTAWSDVLWRIPPWTAMPAWTGGFEYADYRYGQPRVLLGRVVHTSTDLDPEVVPAVIRAHRAAGRRVWVVLYDHGPADDYPGLVRRVLGDLAAGCRWVGEDVGLGTDLLCKVSDLED